MASQATENPYVTFTGLDGQPLQDGYVYFGQPDLNSIEYPVSVYWDEALTVPAAQPIRTNAGYLWRNGTPARVWVNGNYSTLVQDSKRRQVYYAPDWSAASSANITYLQSGSGAVLRDVQDRLRDSLHLFDFMTPEQIEDVRSRTGSLDVSTPVIVAIANAVAKGGATIVWPAGLYNLAQTIPFRTNVQHAGMGRGVTVVKATHNGNIFGEAFPAAAHSYCGITGMSINGNNSALSFPADDADGNGLRLNQVSNSIFDLEVYNTIFNGISVYNLSNDNVFLWPKLTGIGKSGTPPGAASWTGIFFEFSANRNKVYSPYIDTTLQYGIWIGARDADNFDNEIHNPYVANTTSDGIRIGDDVTSNVCYRPIVTNPRVSGAGGIGIRLFHAGTGLVEDAQIIGGVIRDCTTMGMLIDERVSGAVVVGTRIVDCGNYGVTVVNSANVNKLVGVTATGAVLTDIRNLNINTLLIGTEVIDGRQGPFTPQILTGGAAVGRTYSTQSGQYRVNGNCVEFSLSIVLTAAGSSTGNLTISGLPFLSAATGPFSQVSPQYAQLTLLGDGFNVFGLILNAANAITLFQVESASGSTALTETALAANTEIYISGRYFI